MSAVRILIVDDHAIVNAKHNGGKTTLMLAETQGHTEVVELLKKAGAKE